MVKVAQLRSSHFHRLVPVWSVGQVALGSIDACDEILIAETSVENSRRDLQYPYSSFFEPL